jgi:pimeloyl-ACP methyl ester carboxylesterase
MSAILCPDLGATSRPLARCAELSAPDTGGGGRLLHCRRAGARPAPYFLRLPPGGTEGAPVLVAVHGISRNAREQVEAFGAEAARLGMVTVGPLFARRRFPAYQRLGRSRRGVVSNPDRALEAILEEVAEATGADVSRIFLFGFSGGAQFAHRFTMRYPHRVRAMVLGSAGWYTFPDVTQPFPLGLGATPLADGFDPQDFLRVPGLVLVGEADRERDAALNTSGNLDLMQGRTRIERGQRWRDAMNGLAARIEVPAHFDFDLLAGCGHDFGDCVRSGDLVRRALDFFVATSHRAPRPPERRERQSSHLVFSAGG